MFRDVFAAAPTRGLEGQVPEGAHVLSVTLARTSEDVWPDSGPVARIVVTPRSGLSYTLPLAAVAQAFDVEGPARFHLEADPDRTEGPTFSARAYVRPGHTATHTQTLYMGQLAAGAESADYEIPDGATRIVPLNEQAQSVVKFRNADGGAINAYNFTVTPQQRRRFLPLLPAARYLRVQNAHGSATYDFYVEWTIRR